MRWAIAGAAGLLLASCSSVPVQLPEGVTVSAYQGRFDRAERQLELKVTNTTDATFTVTSAVLDSTRFVDEARWDRPQDIPSGSARDLRVALGAADCSDTPALDEVVLDFVLPNGSGGSARLTIVDASVIDAINSEDCLAEAVAKVATIEPSDSLRWMPGARLPATLDLTVTPTGAPGSIGITESTATVLLSLVDDGGAPVFSLPQTVVVDADSAPAVIPLRLIPARCDPHAVAEDKRGTIFPLQALTSDGDSGQVLVPVSDAIRAELYAFYADYCGLP
ncbi:MAG: hypothetical protein Q8M65_07740 [Rhodoglobus sp.]|nr:hypothetical protein [Rhodoglobus sp.]